MKKNQNMKEVFTYNTIEALIHYEEKKILQARTKSSSVTNRNKNLRISSLRSSLMGILHKTALILIPITFGYILINIFFFLNECVQKYNRQ